MFKFSDKIPSELIKRFQENKCGIYVGAGLSVAAGLPDWEGLLIELIAKAKEEMLINDNDEMNIKDMIGKKNFLQVAEEISEMLPNEIIKYIRLRFDDDSIHPTETHNFLMELPYRFLITTNYDSLIENSYAKKIWENAQSSYL